MLRLILPAGMLGLIGFDQSCRLECSAFGLVFLGAIYLHSNKSVRRSLLDGLQNDVTLPTATMTNPRYDGLFPGGRTVTDRNAKHLLLSFAPVSYIVICIYVSFRIMRGPARPGACPHLWLPSAASDGALCLRSVVIRGLAERYCRWDRVATW